jgi:hypothetical protein
MEAESVSTGRTGVRVASGATGTVVWFDKGAVTISVAETGILCWAQAERKETRVAIANRLEARL